MWGRCVRFAGKGVVSSVEGVRGKWNGKLKGGLLRVRGQAWRKGRKFTLLERMGDDHEKRRKRMAGYPQ